MQTIDKEQTEGSPTTKPCANSEMSGTAGEQSAAAHINIPDDTENTIRAGAVPVPARVPVLLFPVMPDITEGLA